MATITLASGAGLEIADVLYEFVRDEAVNGTAWTADQLFGVLGELVQEFGPRNQELLAKRISRQEQIVCSSRPILSAHNSWFLGPRTWAHSPRPPNNCSAVPASPFTASPRTTTYSLPAIATPAPAPTVLRPTHTARL